MLVNLIFWSIGLTHSSFIHMGHHTFQWRVSISFCFPIQICGTPSHLEISRRLDQRTVQAILISADQRAGPQAWSSCQRSAEASAVLHIGSLCSSHLCPMSNPSHPPYYPSHHPTNYPSPQTTTTPPTLTPLSSHQLTALQNQRQRVK